MSKLHINLKLVCITEGAFAEEDSGQSCAQEVSAPEGPREYLGDGGWRPAM
jgi:hypothetical protein